MEISVQDAASSAFASAANELNDLSKEKLVRKCRDLLALKKNHLVVIKTLESENATFRIDKDLDSKHINKLKSDHAASLSDIVLSHNSQIKAMKEQHSNEVRKVKRKSSRQRRQWKD